MKFFQSNDIMLNKRKKKQLLIIIFTIVILLVIRNQNNVQYLKNKVLIRCQKLNIEKYKVKIDGVTYPREYSIINDKSIDYKCLEKSSPKIILLWNHLFSKQFQNPGVCPLQNCIFTRNRTYQKDADLVMVNMINEINDLPLTQKFRPEKQRWVFNVYETPKYYSKNFTKYNVFFNLTSTYLRNSDYNSFYTSYFRNLLKNLDWGENPDYDPTKNYHSSKTKMTAAIISNCGDKSGRLKYIKELSKHTKVTIFGKNKKCAVEKCPTQYKNGKIGECKEILAEDFKFYLSFENSICKDYITEKFFSILSLNIIPVVLGGGDYDQYVPKSGYINALDYKTPKGLANYLEYLDSNSTAYNSYFQWKKFAVFTEKVPDLMCSICIDLHLETTYGIRKGVVNDLENFYTNKDCKNISLDF